MKRKPTLFIDFQINVLATVFITVLIIVKRHSVFESVKKSSFDINPVVSGSLIYDASTSSPVIPLSILVSSAYKSLANYSLVFGTSGTDSPSMNFDKPHSTNDSRPKLKVHFTASL